MYEPERSVSPEPTQIYGQLHHLKYKSKAVKQTCDINCPQFTIGRDPGNDIRIHALEVSRVHCKIDFDLLTGKATLQVLSKSGLKINKVLLPLGTEHTLQNGDVISVAVRRFKFEYPDSSSGSSLEAPWLPDSPAPVRTAAMEHDGSSPAKASPSKASARFGSTRPRNSMRLHLFPEHAASDEVKKVLSALAGGEDDDDANTTNKKRDLAYMEMVMEDDDPHIGIEEKILASPLKTQCVVRQSFATPQPAKRALKAPRTSLVPRTKKNVRIQEASPIKEVPAEHATPRVATPSQIPLPLPKDTPYVADSEPQGTAMQYDHEFDNSFASSDGPVSPSPLDHRQAALSTPTPKNKYADLLAREENPSTPVNNGAMASRYETPRNVPLPASMNTPYALYEQEAEDVEMEDVEDVQEDRAIETPSTPPARSTFHVEMTSPENETDENVAPSAASPERNEVDLRNLMPLTPKPRTGRNSLRRNLLLHSSQKVMEAQMMQRARTMQNSYSSRGAQLIAPTPIRPASGTPYKTALPSPGMTNYASSDSDEEERDDLPIFEDASDHFDEDEDYEDVSGAYETDAEELKADEEDEDEDEDEEEREQNVDEQGDQAALQTPQRSTHSNVGRDPNSVDSASLTPSIRRLINQEIAAAGDSSDEDVDRSLDFNPEDDSDDEHEQDASTPHGDDELLESDSKGHVQVDNVGSAAAEPGMAPQPQTPAYRTLGQRFFTPQYEARKSARRQPRKSLCDEFGPPVKFQAVLATPVRQALTKMELDSEENSEGEEEIEGEEELKGEDVESVGELEDEAEGDVNQTETEPLSYKEEFQRAELEKQQAAWEKRQEAQSSRRVLPAPPSNFETPQDGSEAFEMKVAETKMHPVLAARDATEISSDEEDNNTEKSALSDLKSQLKALRRKSLHRNSVGPAGVPDRRATLGVPAPSTPQASSSKQISPRSAAPASRFSSTIPKVESRIPEEPTQATVSMREVNFTVADAADMNEHGDEVELKDDQASDQGSHDGMDSVYESDDYHDVQDEPFEDEHEDSEISAAAATDSMAKLKLENPPATPEYRGIKEMLSVKAMQTPKFNGIREMYAEPKVTQTPAMNGLKHMFAQPKSPHTPDMTGLKHMLAKPAISSTPDYGGMQDVLYQSDAAQQPAEVPTEEAEVDMAEPGMKVTAQEPLAVAAEEVVTSEEAAEPVVPVRRTRRAVAEPTSSAKASTSTATAARRTRTKVADDAPTEASTRTFATPAEPVKRTRVRAVPAVAEPAVSAKPNRAVKAPVRATRAKASATPEVPDSQEANVNEEVDDDTIILVKPAVPSAIGRRPVATKIPAVAARKAAPLKATTAPAQASKEPSETTAAKPKPRATRVTKAAVKVEENLQQEDIEPPKRATRTRADLSAPTAASKAKAAGNAASDAGATTKRAPAARTRAAVQTPVVTDEPAAPKRVTRARK